MRSGSAQPLFAPRSGPVLGDERAGVRVLGYCAAVVKAQVTLGPLVQASRTTYFVPGFSGALEAALGALGVRASGVTFGVAVGISVLVGTAVACSSWGPASAVSTPASPTGLR